MRPSLFGAQRRYAIDAGRSPRGNRAGGQHHPGQERGSQRVDRGLERRHAEELAAQTACEHERHRNPEGETGKREPRRAAQHVEKDATRIGAKRKADAELARAFGNDDPERINEIGIRLALD